MHAKGPNLSHTMCLRDGDRGTAGSSLPAPHPPILASPSSSSPYPAWPLHVYKPLATECGQRLAHSRFEPGMQNLPPSIWAAQQLPQPEGWWCGAPGARAGAGRGGRSVQRPAPSQQSSAAGCSEPRRPSAATGEGSGAQRRSLSWN